jgi:glycosyltransferase involved in cell wall biosynthesis
MIKVSVIVTSYNNAHNLEQCLNSLLNQDYDKRFIDLEIIVVDSGSTDGSVEILNKYKDRIKIILKPKKFSSFRRLSPAQARNIGVQNSKGEILIFTDSDCGPPLDWVREMVASFQKYQVDCIIGNREPDVGEGLGTFVRRYDFILYSNKFEISKPILINKSSLIQKRGQFVLLAGNNFGIKRELWNIIGGMKTIFKNPTGEDVMMEIEIIKQNKKILFAPHIKVSHIHPISLTSLLKKAIQHGESTYLLGKYSNNLINWKYFVERGHILHLKKASICFSLFILGLSSIILTGISSPIVVIFFFIILLVIIFFFRSILLKNKLDLILHMKGEEYRKSYGISISQLFLFEIIHFFTKFIALISFLYSYIKYAYFLRGNIKK